MAREVHVATVTRNTDPESEDGLRGSVFFESASITGGDEYSEPAFPCFPFAGRNSGFFYVPGVGDVIEVEIDIENPDHPNPTYRCGVYSTQDDIDDLFKVNYPNRLGWVTKGGHFFIFDDTNDQETVRLGHAKLTQLIFESNGDWIEDIVRSKVADILKDYQLDIGGRQDITVAKDSTTTVRGNETKVTKGDFIHDVTGDYIMRVQGAFRPESNGGGGGGSTESGKPKEGGSLNEQVEENGKGFRKISTGGGYSHSIGGSKSESIVMNHEQNITGTESKLCGDGASHVYGTGYSGTIGVGNLEWLIGLGNMVTEILAGNIDLSTLLGSVDIGSILGGLSVDLAGGVSVSNALGGGIEIDPAGNPSLDGTIAVFLGGANYAQLATNGVLTWANNPVIDNITGVPHIPSLKVISA